MQFCFFKWLQINCKTKEQITLITSCLVGDLTENFTCAEQWFVTRWPYLSYVVLLSRLPWPEPLQPLLPPCPVSACWHDDLSRRTPHLWRLSVVSMACVPLNKPVMFPYEQTCHVPYEMSKPVMCPLEQTCRVSPWTNLSCVPMNKPVMCPYKMSKHVMCPLEQTCHVSPGTNLSCVPMKWANLSCIPLNKPVI